MGLVGVEIKTTLVEHNVVAVTISSMITCMNSNFKQQSYLSFDAYVVKDILL